MPRKKLSVSGGMQVNVFTVLSRAVEEGTIYGWRRAHKYEENPSEERICSEIGEAVINAICEVFNFPDPNI